ncbi:MAG: glycerol-3-phosphate 1-O-acyltransferase PlsY [candidate division WOR-3 bacterium]|nr:glycerol-3-phosphate 1-O-acyltransferase PlsY [candidate division WOR-3 bacterium]
MPLIILFPIGNSIFPIYFVSLIIGYLIGSIPFGFLISRLKKIDIRRYGSKNIGFTNVYRALGPLYAVPVLILDVAKGFLPTYFANNFELIPAIVALGTVLGHIFTPFLRFKGGKGVATTIGALLALKPLVLFVGIIIFVVIFFSFSYVSLASVSFALSLPITTLILYSDNTKLFFSLISISLLIIISHRTNFRRLLSKTEPKFSLRKKIPQ